MSPHQPIHFARGYSWIPLFLLAAPRLILVFERVPWRSLLGGAILLLALSDNLIWLLVSVHHQHAPVTLTPERKDVLDWLQQNVREQELLISDDGLLAYLGSVYSPIRAWRSHPFNTPYSDQRKAELEAFFREHNVLQAWQGKTALVLFDRTRSGVPELQAADQKLLSNRKYILIRRHFAGA